MNPNLQRKCIMRWSNEHGITLIELLAVLAITGIIVVGIMSVLSTGTNSADRTSTRQELQQEGNLIVERIRAHYLENPIVLSSEIVSGCNKNQLIKISVGPNGSQLKMDGALISEGHTYVLSEGAILCREKRSPFKLTLKKDGQEFVIQTAFSKLN